MKFLGDYGIAAAKLPAGKRVSSADALPMPKIIAPNTSAAIQTAAGAHHYRLIGRTPDSTARLILHVLLTATRIDGRQHETHRNTSAG